MRSAKIEDKNVLGLCLRNHRERDNASKSGSESGLKAVRSAHVQVQYKPETCRTLSLPQGVKVPKEPTHVSKAHVRGVKDADMTFPRIIAALASVRFGGYKILGHQIHRISDHFRPSPSSATMKTAHELYLTLDNNINLINPQKYLH
jgi:hypothetical protein